jgi:uncharacterized protein (DUF362 family)
MNKMKSIVSLIKCDDIENTLIEALKKLGDIEEIFPQNATVMIKPNFTGALPPETGAASDPRIAEVLAKLALRAGAAKVIIAEGMGASHVTLEDVKGLREISELKGVEVVDLNDEPTEEVRVADPLQVERFKVPRVVLECDFFINLGKLKVHPQAMMSLVMKNLLGALPGRSYRDDEEARRQGYLTPIIPGEGKKIFHDLARDRGTDAMQKAIIDLNTVIPTHLSIIDGLYGMEGEGAPTRGKPVKMDLLIAGTDIVATEAIGASVMGFEPTSMPYLEEAVKKGLGSACKTEEIDLGGVSLSKVCRPFERANVSSTWR